MSAHDYPGLRRGVDDTSPAAMFALMRDRFAQVPVDLLDGYEVVARMHAAGLRGDFPTVAPELLAAITANVVAKLGGGAQGDPGRLPPLGFENASNAMLLCALRLWESGS